MGDEIFSLFGFKQVNEGSVSLLGKTLEFVVKDVACPKRMVVLVLGTFVITVCLCWLNDYGGFH